MKKRIIEADQEDLIVCDNTNCNFKVVNHSRSINEDISMFLNKPCPDCGQNLLTEEDYKKHKKVINRINFINKWFSWLLVRSKN